MNGAHVQRTRLLVLTWAGCLGGASPQEDLQKRQQFIRAQITTAQVSASRLFNWDQQRRRKVSSTVSPRAVSSGVRHPEP